MCVIYKYIHGENLRDYLVLVRDPLRAHILRPDIVSIQKHVSIAAILLR